MTPDDNDTLAVLREMRDNQRLQLERQAEALALQRGQFEMYKQQYDRAERINDRAEAIQARQSGYQDFVRRLMWVLVPTVVLMASLVLWPYLVNLWR